MLLWITGLSGAGKTTLALELKKTIANYNRNVILLDGDELRQVLGCETLHYTPEERKALAFCYARLAHLLSEQNHLVIVATISMFADVRAWNRTNNKNYIEVYLRIPADIRRSRSTKDVYVKNENIVELEGIFEEPQNADFVFDNHTTTEEMVRQITQHVHLES